VTRTPKGLADLESLEKVFGALAHTSRRSILLVLHARGGSMTSKDIADRFDCAWPTVTRHLGILEEAGLVHVEHSGRERRYTVDPAHLLHVAGGWLARFGASPSTVPGGETGAGARPAAPRKLPTRCERPAVGPAATPRR
jgi:DNA-binding transcriptional ArsR family regulator